MKLPLAILACAVGCEAATPVPTAPVTTAPPPTPRASVASCRGTTVGVTPADRVEMANGNFAILHGSFEGDGMGPDDEYACVESGGTRQEFVHGLRTRIRASATELQRITIGGPVLIAVPPGGDVEISYHPCMNWQLGADWLDDPAEIDTEDGIAVRKRQACPRGFIEGGKLLSAADPRCHGEDDCGWRRCVRAATLDVDATASGIKLVDHDPQPRFSPGKPVPIAPYGAWCPVWDVVDTGTEQVRIAPGIGEHWTLSIDAAGRLQGTYTTERKRP